MSTNLEIEFKSKLLEEEYNSLLLKYSNQKSYSQTNYYIDDKNQSIINKKCGLRIREKEGCFELTLKVPSNDGKIEINQQISNEILKKFVNCNVFPGGEVKDFLTNNLKVKTDNLYVLGKLVTLRLDLNYKTSLISIDKSSYNSKIDYEIECEDTSIALAKNNLLDFLKENKIAYKQSSGNKLDRFLKTLNN